MAETFNHQCIKPQCTNKYEDTEPDAYYCPSCVKAKQKIAASVDAKLAGRSSRKVKSALQEYDEAEKVHGFMRVRL